MAARLITSVPIWSAISSVFLSQLKIPPDIKKVIIFSDNDSSESGQKAAQKLASSLIQEGRMVKIFAPKKPNKEQSRDWLDALEENKKPKTLL